MFVIIGREVGDAGNNHLQGFIHLKTKIRMQGVKRLISIRAHVEKARGSDTDNDTYCSKEGDEFARIGVAQTHAKGGGGETMTRRVIETIQAKVGGATTHDLLTSEASFAPYMIYNKIIEKTVNEEKQVIIKKKILNDMRYSQFKEWQIQIMREVRGPTDPRTITWVYDQIGGSGKTYLSKYLLVTEDCIRFENGSSSDIKYAYGGQRIVLFDLARSQEQSVNFEVIESIKNGVFFSTKYESMQKIFEVPHVVVFANWAPDMSKLSVDRWNIINVDNTRQRLFENPFFVPIEPENEVITISDDEDDVL